jgi:manganese-dependent inorganic pyrophosphatase
MLGDVTMKTFVFGHKKPDTDSVCSAIAYSYLKNELGIKSEPRVLGDLNKETKFVLNYFNIKEPRYLNDVKVQIKNMSYLKEAYVDEQMSIEASFRELQSLEVTGLPIVDKDKNLKGYINLKEICKYIIDGNIYALNTSYDNILESLNATSFLRFDNEFTGKILAAAYKSTTFTERVKLTSDNILIVADRVHIIKYAIESGVKLIIIVGNNKFPDELIDLAKKNKVNVIITPYTTYLTANKIKLCNYISNINVITDPITFNTSDYRDDFIDIASKFGHTNYPIVDLNNKCVGMLRLIDQNRYEKCNVILVDHNQEIQSADGINEANILEIVDHHNLGTIGTSTPIAFRAMPVGCTSTIIYQLFQEKAIKIPADIAGLMLSAILSDTLIFKSPTTTKLDCEVAKILAEIADLDIDKYGMSMLKAGSSIEGMTYKEIVEQDYKTYKIDDYNIGIGQVMTLDIDNIMKEANEYIDILNNQHDNFNYKISLMFVTDVIKNGSYLFYNDAAKGIVSSVYGIKDIKEGTFLPNIVSRKKQMLPDLMDYLQ